jgi:HD-GYP domain-containing protein (c-di-GMP phosphodiesterase class II)
MHLVSVSVETIRIGQPLPFSLMDKDGVLLAKRSFVIESKEVLAEFAARGGGLYIDVSESEAHHRAYLDRLNTLVRDNKPLGEIAGAQISAAGLGDRLAQENEHPDWLDLQVQASALLRDAHPSLFLEKLGRLHDQLRKHCLRHPDGTLFALIHLSATEPRMYSATHAMLVSVMCGLAAKEVLQWPAEQEEQVRKVALTMNLAMTDLQDRLALQLDKPTAPQKSTIASHAERSSAMLMTRGVISSDWLEAVRDHHTHVPGPLRDRSVAQQMARLVQRADMFAARLSPRAGRVPVAPAVAMQACYFDENRQIDEAGAALIKAVGIYQPGSFVRLATEEVAVVVKRGLNTSTPRVAVLINRSGMPTVEPIMRDTSVREHRVIASVAHREVRVQINLERMLPLTVSPQSDRPW